MDEKYMRRALELALKGWGKTNPNPLVGAVIVKEGRIIGEGAHERLGGPHAEINALMEAGDDAWGSEIYVTLEPCSHYGRTPPCAKALIEAGVAKVIIAMEDPNPKVSGRGIHMLREAGIHVETGVLEEEAEKLNEIFIKYVTRRSPFVIMKTAMSMDGKIASYTGDSKWITGEKAREYVHTIRDRVSSIMVGINTVMRDNPYLTARIKNKEASNPVRIIVDSKGRIPLDSNVLNISEKSGAVIATTELMPSDKEKQLQEMGAKVIRVGLNENQVNLSQLMNELYNMEIDSVLLEGGSSLNASALESGIVDKMMFFIAPKIIGGLNAPGPVGGKGIEKVQNALKIRDTSVRWFDEDIMIEGYVGRG